MPIIKQLNATKFRSLKYGNDTSDGGSSRQPYMKVELKDIDKPFTRLRLTKFDDGLIRGGAVGALNAAAVDTLRIGKFFKDLPKGPLFLIKQVGLQLSNPRLEAKKGATGFLSSVGPTRIYNLGINTIAQVPLNAFGGHLVRHGLLSVMDDNTKYLSVVTENNKNGNGVIDSESNRLVGLRNKFHLGDGKTEISEQFNLKEARRTNRLNNINERQANRDLNRTGRQANRDLNQMGREINRNESKTVRKFNRLLTKTYKKDNKDINKQGRQDNRSVNQSTRQGAKTEGFKFTRSKYERISVTPYSPPPPPFERSSFYRTSFNRTPLDTTTLTIDSYTGGPNSVYGIGRTIINRYNFTEDKIKIDDAFNNARNATILGSLSVNPLTDSSKHVNVSGSFTTSITGATIAPLSPWPLITVNVPEDDQFNALSRKTQPDDFFYGTDTPTSILQNAIGDGNITTDPHIWLFDDTNSFGTGHVPKVNPIISAPFDKFQVIKKEMDLVVSGSNPVFKYKDEDPTYIGGIREIKRQKDTTIQGDTNITDPRTNKTITFKGKQADLEKFLKENLQDYSQVKGKSLQDVVVGTGGNGKKVKASIINVKGFEKENRLEKLYKSGSMVSQFGNDDESAKSVQDLDTTQKITIDRNSKRGFYFNGELKVSNFERFDPGIMSVHFNSINPFDATNLSSIFFSAYMSGFKYGATATWNPIKYVGRSESFYTFTETKRDVSFSLQIPCFNPVELLENHSKLSELQSVLAGKYSTDNRLGGIITAITLGSYLIGEPGILTSISFDIPDTSSWDIDLGLAMYLNAQFSFTIIGKALPEFKKGGYLFGKTESKVDPSPKKDLTKGDSEQKLYEKFTLRNLSKPNIFTSSNPFNLIGLPTNKISSTNIFNSANPFSIQSLTGKSAFSSKNKFNSVNPFGLTGLTGKSSSLLNP